MVTNKNRRVLYTGFTGNLQQRIEQHKAGTVNAFTKKYNAHILLYYEMFDDIDTAKRREKAIKKWNRSWKEELLDEHNPHREEIPITS